MIPEDIVKLHERLASHNGECFLCLATTANVNNPPVLVGSLRLADGMLAGNIIFRDTSLLPEIVKRFDGLVTCFFVDCEIKAGIDLGNVTLELIPQNRRHYFKPNDFTVEAADEWVAQRIRKLQNARVAIVGAGNIGAKLALRLAERGCDVRLVGRNVAVLEITMKGLNAILRGNGAIIAMQCMTEACAQADVIIGCTPGTAVIGAEAIAISQASLLLDIGNGCFTRDAIVEAQERELSLEVLSPTAGWEGFLRRYMATRKLQEGLGRRQLSNGDWIVSRGIIGANEDVLVDDILQPTSVIGVCNGMGDLLYSEEAMQKIKSVEKIFGIV